MLIEFPSVSKHQVQKYSSAFSSALCSNLIIDVACDDMGKDNPTLGLEDTLASHQLDETNKLILL